MINVVNIQGLRPAYASGTWFTQISMFPPHLQSLASSRVCIFSVSVDGDMRRRGGASCYCALFTPTSRTPPGEISAHPPPADQQLALLQHRIGFPADRQGGKLRSIIFGASGQFMCTICSKVS